MMGYVSTLCGLITSSAKLFLILLVIAYLVNLLPSSTTFTAFDVTPPKRLEGKLTLNALLNNVERLFEHEIKGPEGFAVLKGELYTTLHGGYVAKIENNKIVPVVKFGKPCDNWWDEDKCGRPLGLAATADGNLVVADAYYGIWLYNPKSGKSTVLVDKDTVIEGKKAKIFNSVAVGKNNVIYWTHSSSDFDLNNGVYAMLADPSGRLIRYDPTTKQNTVLLDKLHFANGVALSPDEDFVIVAETVVSRIRRVYLKGPKKSQSDIFINGLPGLPDNIRRDGKGGFIVSLVLPRDENNPVLSDFIAPLPIVRKALARFLALGDWSAQQVHKIYPNYYTERLIHIIGHFEMLSPFYRDRISFLVLNTNGEVLDSYHGVDGSARSISDVVVHKDYLYLGSPYNNYLGRIKLSKLGNKLA